MYVKICVTCGDLDDVTPAIFLFLNDFKFFVSLESGNSKSLFSKKLK